MNNIKTTFYTIALICFSNLAAGQQSETSSQNIDQYQCRKACGGASPSPYCLVAPKDKQLGAALLAVKRRLSDKDVNRITSAELKQDFQINDDPCERSDTIRSDGVWTNKGAACDISVNVDVFPGTSKVPILIHIPSELVFATTLQTDGLEVIPRLTSSLLEIQDPDLHNDWGGVVQAVTTNMNSAMFQLPRGCIKIPF